jgi:hypothetical protein
MGIFSPLKQVSNMPMKLKGGYHFGYRLSLPRLDTFYKGLS